MLCLLLTLASTNTSRASDAPNIIFVLVDDLRWDAMGFVGKYAFLKTPNIDRLRSEGVHFENAFVTHALCAPARATFLTGTFSHVHGVSTNQEGREFDPDVTPSFAQLLQADGYKTAFIGKWHMGSGRAPRKGFDYWCSFDGQGKYYDNVLNINGQTVQDIGYVTESLTRYAVQFIETNAANSEPFMLYLSHKAVHEPFTPNEKYSGEYEDGMIPEPESWKDDMADKPAWQRVSPTPEQRTRYREKELKDVEIVAKRKPGPWDPSTGRGRQKDYLRTLSAVDEGLGDIYDVLETKGLLDNTVIVFAGDNGFFHGEHGKGDKRLAYNEAIRIPLVMRAPGLIEPGSTVSEMVLNADIAPTFLNLADVPVPDLMQGESLVPLLQGNPVDWRDAFLYTYWPDLNRFIPRIVALRTHRYLYATTPDIEDVDELYDLMHDPFEMNNLINDPTYAEVRQQLQGELEKLKEEANYRTVVPRPDKQPADAYKTGLLWALDFGEKDIASRITPHVEVQQVGGRAFARFTTGTALSVNDAADVDVSKGRIIIECLIRPTREDGLIVSSGSEMNGWAMFIEEKYPGIVAASNTRTHFADADVAVAPGAQVHLVAVIDNESNTLQIYVNGRLSGEQQIFIPMGKFRDNAGVSLGMDVGDKVDPMLISGFQFEGLIGYVKIYRDTTPTLLAEILTGADVVTGVGDDNGVEDSLSIRVFPNPTTRDSLQVFVETALDLPVRIRVLDALGRTLYDQVFEAQQLIDGKGLAPAGMRKGGGSYIIEVTQGKIRAQQKVIIR